MEVRRQRYCYLVHLANSADWPDAGRDEILSDAKAKGVELAGVNVMTMDYDAIRQLANTEGQNIHGKCATSAIANLHSQLKGLHPNKSDAEIDAMMGTTPMVGVNDVQGEVFYLSMLVWSCRMRRSVISVWLVSGQSRATCRWH